MKAEISSIVLIQKENGHNFRYFSADWWENFPSIGMGDTYTFAAADRAVFEIM